MHAVRGLSLAVLGLALNECPPMGDWVEPVAAGPAAFEAFPRLQEAADSIDEDDGHWQGWSRDWSGV